MFFVSECKPKKCTDVCLGIDISLIRTLNEEYRVFCRRCANDSSRSSLSQFLARKFRGTDMPVSEDSMLHRMRTLKDVSEGTMPMYEKDLME